MTAIGFVITHFGNTYVVATEIAEIFIRKRDRLIAAGRGELVPLPHTRGVDILWVDDTVPCEVCPIAVADGDDPDAVRAQWGLSPRKRLPSTPTGRETSRS